MRLNGPYTAKPYTQSGTTYIHTSQDYSTKLHICMYTFLFSTFLVLFIPVLNYTVNYRKHLSCFPTCRYIPTTALNYMCEGWVC